MVSDITSNIKENSYIDLVITLLVLSGVTIVGLVSYLYQSFRRSRNVGYSHAEQARMIDKLNEEVRANRALIDQYNINLESRNSIFSVTKEGKHILLHEISAI